MTTAIKSGLDKGKKRMTNVWQKNLNIRFHQLPKSCWEISKIFNCAKFQTNLGGHIGCKQIAAKIVWKRNCNETSRICYI